MDIVALVFYAAVCALLGVFAPRFGNVGLRLIVGAGIGILAAFALPFLRALVGA
ncbi:MAG: hypothetical protein AAF771_17485 [Pseudomonadota bacterium]